jgi:hypothetical protein
MTFSLLGKTILVAAAVVACPAQAGFGQDAVSRENLNQTDTGLIVARQATVFDRDGSAAALDSQATLIAARDDRCRFSAGRNPVRPRRNECRLA